MGFNFGIKFNFEKTLHHHSADSKVSDNVLQAQTEGLENIVYKKLIAPHKNELPTTNFEGFTRVCDSRHKYAFMAPVSIGQYFERILLCHITALPDTYYREWITYIISKKSPYTKLINWK
jgi:hypothetical protein